MNHTTLEETLESLAQHCANLTAEALRRNELPLRMESRMRFTCTSFKYSEAGVEAPLRGTAVDVPDWGHASHIILDLVRASAAWRAATRALESLTANEMEIDHVLWTFCQRQILPLLGKRGLKMVTPKQSAAALVRELAGQPMEYRASARLQGFAMIANSITLKLDEACARIRPTTAEDMTFDIPPFSSFASHQLESRPTAILTASKTASGPEELRALIDTIMLTLRLYRVSSASILSIQFDTDASRGLMGLGAVQMRVQDSTAFTSVIHDRDIGQLESFIPMLLPLLPDRNLRQRKSDPLAIALLRYDDSLLKSRTFDERILGAVMALEAAFLSTNETQELSFRLSCRVAHLLSRFRCDPLGVQKCLKLAYKVRSQYVHGGVVTKKDKDRLVGAYGSLHEFTHEVLDITRKALLTMLLAHRPKNEFLRNLDSALVGDESGSFYAKLDQLRPWVHS